VNESPEAAIESAACTLRERLGVARVTVRLDPQSNLRIVAEARAAGVPSLREERAIDQMATETVRWVVANRRVLVNNDAANEAPRTPQAMIEQFGLRAFMIAPIVVSGSFVGTVSIHSSETRVWTQQEIDAVSLTAATIGAGLAPP
jgi:maleate isomerase